MDYICSEAGDSGFQHRTFQEAERCGGQFFMPPWALEEMLNAEVMALHKLNEQVVKERFGIFGGTARLVLREGRDKGSQ